MKIILDRLNEQTNEKKKKKNIFLKKEKLHPIKRKSNYIKQKMFLRGKKIRIKVDNDGINVSLIAC